MKNRSFFSRKAAFPLLLAGLLGASGFAMATIQGEQRRDARDTRQEAKQNARSEKADCRAANNKSNAACRQNKRDNKQQGRQDARDIKY